MGSQTVSPVGASQRYIILDALRGFALLGIVMANFPEFSLYSFMDSAARNLLSGAAADTAAQYFLSVFIDGKFYTIFSLLFGIGFSIIISNVTNRGGNGFKVFYRRMAGLFIIGLIHLLFLWSGDILMLYALVGMLLPLFCRLSDRSILIWAAVFLFLPVIVDFSLQLAGVSLSSGLVALQWVLCDKYGITHDNFAYWLADAQTYGDMLKFLIQGAIERMQEFVDGNRYFKVLGLFLVGYYIGRNRLYADLAKHRDILVFIFRLGLLAGLPLSCVYAYSSVEGHPFGLGMHSVLYFSSVYIMSFGYIAAACLLYLRSKEGAIWRLFAFPGRMALTCYIGQSVLGILIFYGIGLGLGTTMGLIWVELIAIGVFILEILLCALWLGYFRFGPLEWLWRCFTYGKIFKIH